MFSNTQKKPWFYLVYSVHRTRILCVPFFIEYLPSICRIYNSSLAPLNTAPPLTSTGTLVAVSNRYSCWKCGAVTLCGDQIHTHVPSGRSRPLHFPILPSSISERVKKKTVSLLSLHLSDPSPPTNRSLKKGLGPHRRKKNRKPPPRRFAMIDSNIPPKICT